MNHLNKHIRRIRSLSASYESNEFSKISFENNESDENSIFTNSTIYNQKLACSLDRTQSQKAISSFSKHKLLQAHQLKTIEFSKYSLENLPDEIQIRIFLFLNALELGKISSVCQSWRSLLTHTSLWGHVDLNLFSFCAESRILQNDNKVSKSHECNDICYSKFVKRSLAFLSHLIKLRPPLYSLKFSLDIGDTDVNWNDTLLELLKCCRCRELKKIDINWSETTFKQQCSLSLALQTHSTWSHSDFKEVNFRKRLRQRRFVYFFDVLTAVSPNCVSMKLPFDWSARSIQAFSRLQNLEDLKLLRYFTYSPIETSTIEKLILSLPKLKSLFIEAHIESYAGVLFSRLVSSSLQTLDVSKCRGLCFSELDLPELQTIKIERNPLRFSSALVDNYFDVEESQSIKCLHDVLIEGAPNLHQINDLALDSNWQDVPIYSSLNALMQNVCYCRMHYSFD